MELEKKYNRIKFTSQRLKEIFVFWEACYDDIVSKGSISRKINHDAESWSYDSDEEFLTEYNKPNSYAVFSKNIYLEEKKAHQFRSIGLSIRYEFNDTYISIYGDDRIKILKVKNFIEENIDSYNLPKLIEMPEAEAKPVIFIGHGGSADWRDLKDHLTDQHGIEVVAYETGARAGHTIRDILDEMMIKSSFAVLVMTAADEQADGSMNARPNVIHEVGLFQGKLGFNKAIVALEKGTNLFSNLDGIQQLRFSSNNIKEIFGDVLATIKREFNK